MARQLGLLVVMQVGVEERPLIRPRVPRRELYGARNCYKNNSYSRNKREGYTPISLGNSSALHALTLN